MKRPPNNSSSSSSSTGEDEEKATATPPFQTRATRRKTYYQPSVYQFTCRGAFHLHTVGEKAKAPLTTRQQRQQLFNDKAVGGLGTALRDSYTCNGLQTRLRHVADFPLSKSKEEAIQWFEGSPGYRDVSSPMTNRNDGNINKTNNNSNNRKNLNGSGGLKPSIDQKQNNNINKKDNENQQQSSNTKKEDGEPEETHSSYGTTQVNILTVREVPVLSPDEAQRSLMNDPFGGFGNIAPAGMLNPFGSLFGGFFGAGDGSPMDPSSNMPNTMSSGSRSVSSSTRMTRDENGKRVATTITKTTVVDAEGKKRTETETTVRHLDEGGRVETKKVVHVDGGGESSSSSTTAATPNQKDGRNNDARKPQQQSTPHHPHHMPPPYFGSPPGAIIDSSVPPSPPQVCQLATDLRLGLGVTDGTSADPDNPNAPPVRKGSSGGWRKTEYLFRLGRFIPPFLVVSQYYEDKEEEERRRQQLTKEYNEKRQRQKESRWGKSSERQDKQEKSKDDGRSDADDSTTPEMDGANNNFPIPANLPIDTSRTEYFLQRLHTQMEKNAAMMGFMLKQMLKPDFPKKVYHSGERIYENLGPTAERTGKLMKDVWQMWVNNLGNNFGWDQDDGRGGRR